MNSQREGLLSKIAKHVQNYQLKYVAVVGIFYVLLTVSKGTHNMIYFEEWVAGFIRGDFFTLYHVVPNQGVLETDNLTVPYPPFSLYMLGAVAKILIFFGGEFSSVFLVASNLTSVVFTFLTAGLLWYWGRTRGGLQPLFYLITPAVFLISPILGYQDSIMSFFIVAALIAAENQRYFVTGLLASFAVFSKQLAVMPMFGLGLLVLFSLNWKAIHRAVSGFALGFLVILSPFIFTGTLTAYFRAQGLASVHTMMSAQNPNIPWVVGLFSRIGEYGFNDSRSYSTLPLRIAGDNLRQVLYLSFGAITVAAILGWLLFWTKRVGVQNISPIYIGAVAISAYNLLSFGVHENHFFMAIPVLFALAVSQHTRRIYFLASGGLALNLLATCGLGRSVTAVSPITQISGALYTATSMVSLALYVWAMLGLVRIKPISGGKAIL